MRQYSHCIVTPDFIGPINNGGIGTACYELARFFSKERSYRVTILFTGPMLNKTSWDWREHYSSRNQWDFFCLNEVQPPKRDLRFYSNSFWFLERSHRVDLWLRNRRFDAIHFQEWQANGFCAAQAKAQGVAYLDTLLTCTVHSPHEWINEGARAFPSKGIEDLLQHYCERYSACMADVTVFPSEHMRQWARTKQWAPRKEVVVQNIYDGPSESLQPTKKITELCFFGRLETRKGLEVYLAALEEIIRTRGAAFLPQLSFLGKIGIACGGRADLYLKEFAHKHGLKIDVMASLDAHQALDYLKSGSGRVAVVPSLADNLPYTIVECLQRGIPVMASTVGGIPELIKSRQHLFEPRPASLAAKLTDAIAGGLDPVSSGYSSTASKDGWGMISQTTAKKDPSRTVKANNITICVAYYNYGKYLPLLLSSLVEQTALGFSVVVVNDGSTNRHSNEVFSEMRERYVTNPSWLFLEQANAGIGATRNFAASKAKTDYIVFMDADNEAKPEMVEKMAGSMSYSSADCLTCYMEGFEENADTAKRKVVYEFLPTGGCIDAGFFMNVFGDANFIVKRGIFEQLGGFTTARTASFEDWEFLARLQLRGHSLDVIPETLFSYRHTEQGFSRTTSAYLNHKRVVDTYAAHLPPWADGIARASYKLLVPRCDEHPPAAILARLVYRARTTLRQLPPGARTLAEKAYRRIKTQLLG